MNELPPVSLSVFVGSLPKAVGSTRQDSTDDGLIHLKPVLTQFAGRSTSIF